MSQTKLKLLDKYIANLNVLSRVQRTIENVWHVMCRLHEAGISGAHQSMSGSRKESKSHGHEAYVCGCVINFNEYVL